MSTAKRSSKSSTAASASQKIHPLFTGGLKELGTFLDAPPSLIHWLHLDPFIPSSASSTATTTSTTSATPQKVSIVFYDLDGTLIKPKSGAKFPTSRDDWAWWHPSVPKRLQKEHDEGKHIVVISNQADARPKVRSEWRAKLGLIAGKIPAGVPIRVLAALNKGDIHRKPNIGMFQVVQSVYKEQGLEIDMDKSVFVGDAAGRLGGRGISKDHGDTDYKFALNVGLKFLTPEEHFFGDPRPPYPIPPNGFTPAKLASLASLPPVVPSNTPITRPETEIVLFVGPPASGKTTFYRKHFEGKYQHVNQDILKTRDACLKVAEGCLMKGQSVVVDATNRNRDTRSHWVSLSAKLNVPIRCAIISLPLTPHLPGLSLLSGLQALTSSLFHFLCPIDLARHNNVYRALYAHTTSSTKDSSTPNARADKRELLPPLAFTGYTAQFQQPDIKEGFDEIRGVNFVWTGSEEERRFWDMWILDK